MRCAAGGVCLKVAPVPHLSKPSYAAAADQECYSVCQRLMRGCTQNTYSSADAVCSGATLSIHTRRARDGRRAR
jgi:hypothetical protein